LGDYLPIEPSDAGDGILLQNSTPEKDEIGSCENTNAHNEQDITLSTPPPFIGKMPSFASSRHSGNDINDGIDANDGIFLPYVPFQIGWRLYWLVVSICHGCQSHRRSPLLFGLC
jgi:hypothetical protein